MLNGHMMTMPKVFFSLTIFQSRQFDFSFSPMNAKKGMILGLSYILFGVILFTTLKSKTKVIYKTELITTPAVCPNTTVVPSTPATSEPEPKPEPKPEPEHTPEPTRPQSEKKARDTFYFGQYKTPARFSAIANEKCLDSEMDVSYFETCLNKYRDMIKNKEFSRVVEGLAKFIATDPPVDIDPKCAKPPPLPDIKCEDYKSVFGDNVQKVKNEQEQPKIAILVQLGFDVDVLEAYLWEVYDVVDKFFITESLVTHSNRQLRKPLIWELIKNSPRFKRFQDKIVHFVVDDSENVLANGDIWLSENNQERLRWVKFKEWNAKAQLFKDTDIVGFGDLDEIPSRNALAVLKQCTGSLDHVDVGITFLFGDYEAAFRSDWPVPGHPYTLGDPTFFTIGAAKNFKRNPYPNRMRGMTGRYILGGSHVSPYSYLPFLLNKALVASEQEGLDIINGKLEDIEKHYADAIRAHFMGRIKNATQIMDQIKDHYHIPWIIECMPERYPPFFRKKDPRIYYPPCFFNFEC